VVKPGRMRGGAFCSALLAAMKSDLWSLIRVRGGNGTPWPMLAGHSVVDRDPPADGDFYALLGL